MEVLQAETKEFQPLKVRNTVDQLCESVTLSARTRMNLPIARPSPRR